MKKNIDLWFEEFKLARSDLDEAVRKTRSTDAIVSAALTVGVGLLGLLKSQSDQDMSSFVIFGAIVLSLLFDYLVSLNLIYVYDMSQHAARVVALEKKLNSEIGENIFVWESEVSIKLNTLNMKQSKHLTGMTNPNFLRGGLSIILYILYQGWIFFIVRAMETSFTGYLTPSIILGAFNLTFFIILGVQWAKAMSAKFRRRVTMVVEEGFNKDSVTEIKSETPDNTHKNKTKDFKAIAIIVGLTLSIGYFPVLLASVLEKTFWINSSVNFPYVTNTSVWFGDLVFLPLFNAIFVLLIIDCFKRKHINYNKFFIVLALSFALSNIASVIIHIFIWAGDSSTGFMDALPNQLTVAGMFHLVYSGIQASIILTYFYFRKSLLSFTDTIKASRTLAKILVLFCLLSIPNFFISNFLILHHTFFEALCSDWFNLTPLCILLLALFITRPSKSRISAY